MHNSTDVEDIKSAIEHHGHTVINVYNIRQQRTNILLSLFFVDLKPNENNKDIYQIETLNYTKVRFEPPRPKRNIHIVHKSTTFPHRNIYKYTWTSPDGQTHKQIDHVLIDRIWHSGILDVRSFRGADCDTDHYLVVVKVMETLVVRKQAAQKFDGGRFNLRKLLDPGVRKEYQIEITNRFAALENVSEDEDITRAWDSINPLNAKLNPICHWLALLRAHHILHVSRIRVKENIKTSATDSLGMHEIKKYKPWFDEECLGFLDQRKQAKMQWIQDPSQSIVDTLNKVRRDASRHFGNKKKAYLKGKIEELETDSKINNISDLYRGINDVKKGYQPRTGIVKDEEGDMVADSHSIMARWRNYFSQILNVHGVIKGRQAEIHTA